MRTRIAVDGATPAEVYNLTLAFQRTLIYLPAQITITPTVTVCGTAMGWQTPALTTAHTTALLAEYAALAAGSQ